MFCGIFCDLGRGSRVSIRKYRLIAPVRYPATPYSHRAARESPTQGTGAGAGGCADCALAVKKNVLCTPGGRRARSVRTRWAAACARALCGAQTARCGGGRVCGRPLPPCYQSSCASSILSYATGYLISLSSLLGCCSALAADRCARASRPVPDGGVLLSYTTREG